MTQHIIKRNSLSAAVLQDLIALEQTCLVKRQFHTIMYWDAIKDQQNSPCHFFYYEQQKLIGYLSYFLFDEDAVHISVLIQSKRQSAQIFSQLLEAAQPEILRLGIQKIITGIDDHSENTLNSITALGATLLHSEYSLIRNSPEFETLADCPLQIRTAKPADISLLAELDAACFNGDYSVMLARFNNTITASDRIILMAYQDTQCIGKIHARLDQVNIIHDLCILPEAQNKGYGTYLLKSMINHLITQYHRPIRLDVIDEQHHTLALYQKCHFTIVAKTEYRQLDLL